MTLFTVSFMPSARSVIDAYTASVPRRPSAPKTDLDAVKPSANVRRDAADERPSVHTKHLLSFLDR